MVRQVVVALSLALAACSASSTPSARAALERGATITVLRTVSEPPPGGDGPTIVELEITRGDARRAVRAIGAEPFGDAALVLFEDRSLSRLSVGPDGAEAIDTGVDFVPVLAPDASAFAYARTGDGLAHALVVQGAQGSLVLAEGLASIGALRFVDPATLVFVGARSGGVAGLWIARVAGDARASCLTNCSLRTGEPWGDAFVPPPVELDTLEIDGDALRFVDARGEPRVIRGIAP